MRAGRDDHSALIGNNVDIESESDYRGMKLETPVRPQNRSTSSARKKVLPLPLFLSPRRHRLFLDSPVKQLDYGNAALFNLKRACARTIFVPLKKHTGVL